MRALWNGAVIADSDNTIVVEGNHYFPITSVDQTLLEKSELTTSCHWKGESNYYDLIVKGERNQNAVWYYAHPSNRASQIKDRVAFWHGVEVVE